MFDKYRGHMRVFGANVGGLGFEASAAPTAVRTGEGGCGAIEQACSHLG